MYVCVKTLIVPDFPDLAVHLLSHQREKDLDNDFTQYLYINIHNSKHFIYYYYIGNYCWASGVPAVTRWFFVVVAVVDRQ